MTPLMEAGIHVAFGSGPRLRQAHFIDAWWHKFVAASTIFKRSNGETVVVLRSSP